MRVCVNKLAWFTNRFTYTTIKDGTPTDLFNLVVYNGEDDNTYATD